MTWKKIRLFGVEKQDLVLQSPIANQFESSAAQSDRPAFVFSIEVSKAHWALVSAASLWIIASLDEIS